MTGLSLDLFSVLSRDFEMGQYQILNGLKQIREAFSKNRLYPYLTNLIELHTALRAIERRSNDLRSALPKRIRGFDPATGEILFEPVQLNQDSALFFDDLIEWALPRIEQAIEEGKAIYEFVDERLRLEVVGILPSYVEEGYLLVPEADDLHVVAYRMSIFTSADQRYRSLKTSVLHTLSGPGRLLTPVEVKRELGRLGADLPNPATYFLQTEVPFPLESTVLPVAKRKLLRQLNG